MIRTVVVVEYTVRMFLGLCHPRAREGHRQRWG
jgi:hypothetical protein